MIHIIPSLYLFLLALLPISWAADEAIAYLRPIPHAVSEYPNISGSIVFEFNGTHVHVTGTVNGLGSERDYGLHIHRVGNPISHDGASSFDHFNPNGATGHGCYPDENRHAGDLGNVTTDKNGVGKMDLTLDILSLDAESPNNFLGRTVVLHADPNPCFATSNFGKRIAQGVIGIKKDSTAFIAPNAAPAAVAQVHPTTAVSGIEPSGYVWVVPQDPNKVRIFVNITGARPCASHGFHIHQYGDEGSNALNAGGHYNPHGVSHAAPSAAQHHVGDLGNLVSDSNGNIRAEFVVDFVSLTGEYSIIGRAFVLHEKDDDFITQAAGDAGSRIAVGVIGIANSTADAPEQDTHIYSPDPQCSEYSVIAYMHSTSAAPSQGITGTITFTQQKNDDRVHVNITLSGMEANQVFGVHIHNEGNVVGEHTNSTGSHFNPNGGSHGCYPDAQRHAGDLGNVTSDANGFARAEFYVNLLTLKDVSANNNFIGRSVVVHDKPNPCSGNDFGNRIAHGVIGISNPKAGMPQVAAYNPTSLPNDAVAVARIYPTLVVANNKVDGSVWVIPEGDKVRIFVDISGVAACSTHGFHIHQYGDQDNPGTHYDPDNKKHGSPSSAEHHVGDLGNVKADSKGNIRAEFVVDYVSLTGAQSIIGRAFVLHSGADDFTPPVGNAGSRLGVGIIGYATNSSAPTSGALGPESSLDSACPIDSAAPAVASSTFAIVCSLIGLLFFKMF